jgi:hypothetical protein
MPDKADQQPRGTHLASLAAVNHISRNIHGRAGRIVNAIRPARSARVITRVTIRQAGRLVSSQRRGSSTPVDLSAAPQVDPAA